MLPFVVTSLVRIKIYSREGFNSSRGVEGINIVERNIKFICKDLVASSIK